MLPYNLLNHEFSPSYTRKTIPLLGTALATVMPHPAYNPLIPCIEYILVAVR